MGAYTSTAEGATSILLGYRSDAYDKNIGSSASTNIYTSGTLGITVEADKSGIIVDGHQIAIIIRY